MDSVCPITPPSAVSEAFAEPTFDARLSYCARGILWQMMCHPYRRRFNADALRGESEKDGYPSIRRAMKELESYGYVRRHRGYIELATPDSAAH